jgi:hypothetical protein
VRLKNIKFVPGICSNLFTLNKALMNGFTLANVGVIVSLTKKQVTLRFDVLIKTVGDGSVTAPKSTSKMYGLKHSGNFETC